MVAWPAGLVVGLGAEWLAGSGQSLAVAIADLAVGWTLIACGLLGWARRPQSRVGPLIALTGFAWFLGTLAESHIGAVAALGAAGEHRIDGDHGQGRLRHASCLLWLGDRGRQRRRR
jgi:hypothetical protein